MTSKGRNVSNFLEEDKECACLSVKRSSWLGHGWKSLIQQFPVDDVDAKAFAGASHSGDHVWQLLAGFNLKKSKQTINQVKALI